MQNPEKSNRPSRSVSHMKRGKSGQKSSADAKKRERSTQNESLKQKKGKLRQKSSSPKKRSRSPPKSSANESPKKRSRSPPKSSANESPKKRVRSPQKSSANESNTQNESPKTQNSIILSETPKDTKIERNDDAVQKRATTAVLGEPSSSTSSVNTPSYCTNFLSLLLQFDRLKRSSCEPDCGELFSEVSKIKDSIFKKLTSSNDSSLTLDEFMLCACDDTDIARAKVSYTLIDEPSNDDEMRNHLLKSLQTVAPDSPDSALSDSEPYDLEDIWRRTPFKNHKLTFATVRSILDCFHDFWSSSRNVKDPAGYNMHTRVQLINMINEILKKCGIQKNFTVNAYSEALCFLTDGAITSCSGNYEANVVEFLVKYSGTGKVFKLKPLTTSQLLDLDNVALLDIKNKFSGIRLEFEDTVSEADDDGSQQELVGKAIIKLLGWEESTLKLFATFDAGSRFTKLVFDAIPRVKLLQTQANMFDSGNVEEVWTEERKFVCTKTNNYTCDPKQFMTRIAVAVNQNDGIKCQTDDKTTTPAYPLFQFKSFEERFPNKGPLSFMLELHLSKGGTVYKWKFGEVGNGKYIKNGPSAAALEAVAKYGLCGGDKNHTNYSDIASVTCDMRVLSEPKPLQKEKCVELENLFMHKFAAYAVKCYGDSEQSRMAYKTLHRVFENNWRCILAGVDQISCITAALRRNMAGFCSLNAAKSLLIYFPLNETPLGDVDEFGVVLYEFQTFGEKIRILENGFQNGETIDNITAFIEGSIAYNESCETHPQMTDSGKNVIKLVISRLTSIKNMIVQFKNALSKLKGSSLPSQQDTGFGQLAMQLLELLKSNESSIIAFFKKNQQIKPYAIRIMKETIKVGNMNYMNALTLLETIFDTKTTILENQLENIDQISKSCKTNLEAKKFLVGFDFKLANNMKLNNSIICSQLKFKYEDYRKLYVSLYEYEELFKKFTLGGRTQGFIKRYTSIIPKIDEQLDIIQKNHIENGESTQEIIECENGLTSILFELQKINTVREILKPPPILEADSTDARFELLLSRKNKLEEEKNKLEDKLKNPTNKVSIINAFNSAKSKLHIADINAVGIGESGGLIDIIKTNLTKEIFGGGIRKKRTRDIMVGGTKISVNALVSKLNINQQNELFDMLFQLFANVHRQVLDVFFHIYAMLCEERREGGPDSINVCIENILIVVKNYNTAVPDHINRTQTALNMIVELINDIKYTVEVGFRIIILHFVNFCDFVDLEHYKLDEFKVWEILPKYKNVILMYLNLQTQFGEWECGYQSEEHGSVPTVGKEETVKSKLGEDAYHSENVDFNNIVADIIGSIKEYTKILSANIEQSASNRYEEFLRHITFLIVMVYNANNTYNPSYDDTRYINRNKIIYQPDHNELTNSNSNPRLSVKRRRILSQRIFESNITETNTALKLIRYIIHINIPYKNISVRPFKINPRSSSESSNAVVITVGGSMRKYTRKKVKHLKQIRNTRRNNKIKNAVNQTKRNSHKYGSSSTQRKRSLKKNK